MPVQYTYQQSGVVNTIAPELIQSTAMDDPIFQYFPMDELHAARLRWTILDNYRGLMNLRGYDGAPTRVLRPGETMYETLPGVFGEFGQLDELELTTRAANFAATTAAIPMDVSDMVREWQSVLTVRQVQRMIQMAWTLATTHNLTIPLPMGGAGYTESYPGQTVTLGTFWSNLTASTPIHDLRQLQLVYGRGTSNDFTGPAEAWMNSRTSQYLMDNRNPNDAGGIRADYGATIFNSISKFNEILVAQGAPKIMISDRSYQVDNTAGPGGTTLNNSYQLYLPDGVVWVVAARPGGEKPGKFLYTRHMVNGGGTKPYAFIRDFTNETQGRPEVPPRIEVHQGFNGGAVQTRPSQTVTMIVA